MRTTTFGRCNGFTGTPFMFAMSGRRSLPGICSIGRLGAFSAPRRHPILANRLRRALSRPAPSRRPISGVQSPHSIGTPLIRYAAASTAGHHARSTGPSGSAKRRQQARRDHVIEAQLNVALSKSIAYPSNERGDRDQPCRPAFGGSAARSDRAGLSPCGRFVAGIFSRVSEVTRNAGDGLARRQPGW